MKDEWKTGQRAYTASGREVTFFARSDRGDYVVQTYYEVTINDHYQTTEEVDGDLITVREIFKKPPTEKLHAEVRQLSDEVTELRRELNDARDRLRTTKRVEETFLADQAARLEKHDAIAHVLDFVEGEITHFTLYDYGRVSVISKEDALKDTSARGWSDGNTKLLTLYVKSSGDLQWRINQYRDGSGKNTDAWPFTSLEGARLKAFEIVGSIFDEYTAGDDKCYNIHNAMESARTLELAIPDDVTKRYNADLVAGKQSVVADANAKLVKAKAELAELKKATS